MRAFAIIAIAAGAAAEDVQYGHYDEPAFVPAMVPRDDCPKLPKLCTDAVMLDSAGGLTTLTYLCPETAARSTVTVTTTSTTTVTADLPDITAPPPPSPSFPSSIFDIAPTSLNEDPSTSEKPTTSEEPTTTMTMSSTTRVTVTYVVTEPANPPSLTPAPILGSFTAVLPSKVGVSLTTPPFANSSTAAIPTIIQSDPVAVVAASSISGSIDYSDIFPSHTVPTISSSAAYSPPVTSSSSIDSSSSAAYSAPLYSNSTSSSSSHSGYNAPTFIIGREAKSNSTATAPAATTSKGLADESRVSFIALFLGLVVAARIV